MLILRLGERRLELDPAVLRAEGAALPVGPTAARLLFYLASNRDRVVPTEELVREVWGGTHVTPSSVQQAVRTLRMALDGDGSAFIHTLRGRGYQLGPLVEVSENGRALHELPLVGRAQQLERLSDAVESARSGRGQLLLLAGAPGMGKTRLLQEIEALAPRRGFRFLCGRCLEQSGAPALWPWEEILRGVLELDRSASETLPRSDLAWLQGAFPALGAGPAASPSLDPDSARFRLYEAVRRALAACARTRPLVVAIDDLHRADETSVRLLEWLAARNARERIVLVVAYRELPAQQDQVLRSAVASLLRLPGSGLERVVGLTREHVEEAARVALGSELSAEDVEGLWQRSAGNPFFLKLLVHHLRLGGARATTLALFPEASEAVRQHLQEVSSRTRELLRAAAVLGREFHAERLRRLAGATPEEVSPALEEARAAGLVESGPHAVLRFVHALVAEALHDSFDAETKLALHARATEIFEDDARGDAGALGALAEHAWQAVPRIGAARAAAHCARAAQAALGRYAYEEATRLYERALALSRDAGQLRRDRSSEQRQDAERRQLTVLSCLVDSTHTGTETEDRRALVQRTHAVAGEVIERFEGHVAQSEGDGLLVCFGWPRAHEDDAERAVRAGLGIVEAIRANATATAPAVSVRIGIHTGPVVVGERGGRGRRETIATSDTAKLAACLQGIAEPGAVLMSAATLRLVSGIFVTRERGEHALEGSAESLRVHQAVGASGVRSRLDVAAAAELTPFIGREQELMLLDERFAQVGEGHGQAVLIQGEPGIGKSRLVQAFRERLAERAHTWLECRGSAYTQDSAFYPVLELHRQGLGSRSDEAADAKLDRIAAGLQAVGFDPAATVPVVAALHGIPLGGRFTASNLSPEGMREKTFALLTEWLLRLGQRQPLVLLLEDLHWMDPSTVELVGRILEQVPTAPVLLLATYRPDFEPPWGTRSFLTPMLLSRFTRAQLAKLVRKAGRGRDLPDAWIEEILRRADGVPLFAEELTRALLEAPDVPDDGALPLHVPETLQDSLMARLDALGPAKELAQMGSVLGREFSYDLLLMVSPLEEAGFQAALRSAVHAELFYQRGTPPEATYLFKHALIRDAAYQSMLPASRARHHRRVAETLIERLPQVAETQPELVAQHWSEAGEAATAIAWWIRAGERASEHADCGEGEACARRGLALVDQLSDSDARRERELRLQTLLGTLLQVKSGGAHAETMAVWQRARALSLGETDLSGAALIRYHLSSGHMSAGNYAEALTLAAEMQGLQERLRHPVFEVACHQVRSLPLLYLGRLTESLAGLDAACAVEADPFQTHPLGVEQPVLLRWGFRAWAQWFAGFPDRSRESAERGRGHARSFGNPYGQCYLGTWSAVAALFRRDWSEARRLGSEASQLASKQGFTMLGAVAVFAEATAGVKIDGDGAALERYLGAIGQAGSTGNRCGGTSILGNLADVLLTLDRRDEASRYLEGAFALSSAIDERFYLAELLRLKGEIALLGGHADEAAALFREAIATARGQQARALELRAATSLARLWRHQGKRAEARELLAPLYAWFTEGFDTLDLIEAKALLDELV